MKEKLKHKTCECCGKLFVPGDKGTRFCSGRCVARHLNQNLRPRTVACLNCGKRFKRMERNSKFCSHKCSGIYTRVNKKCKQCGKEFWRKKHTFYCSDECRDKRRQTELETRGYGIFTSLGIEFHKQHRIGPYTADAFISSQNLVVEFDGDYCHLKQETKQRDKEMDKYMKEKGVKVLRFAESQIMNDDGYKKSVQAIRKAVGR